MLKKIFIPSASVIIMLKGITGLQAMPPIETEKAVSVQGKAIKSIKLAKPAGIHYEDRVKLIEDINKDDRELSSALDKRKLIQGELKKEEEKLGKLAPEAGFTSEATALLSDANCFLNTVTKKDAKEYGNLSSLVYDIDVTKKLGGVSSAVTQLDRQITSKLDEISLLEDRQKELRAVANSPENFRKFKNSLNVFGIKVGENATLSNVQEQIIARIGLLQGEYEEFQRQKEAQGTEYLKEAQKLFANNLQGMKYTVEGVFHRNNGEFSGAAAYDKEDKKLVLTFAGSKSAMDWMRNAMGWNRKLSKGHGLLSNIAFHSGFGSHLDDNADSFFSFMKGWLKKFKEENPGETLNLVGTGHSLGGSIGEIFSAAAKELAEAMGIKVKLGIMTFGSPSTVHATALANYNKIIGAGNVLRFEHRLDPLPKVVFWKTAPGEVTIKEDTSLFYDVNGALELPIRWPHANEAYFHSAETVFERWEKSFATLKNQFQQVTQTKNQEKDISQQIGLLSNAAHQKIVQLVNQDKISAATFADEYEDYVAQQRKEVDNLRNELTTLRVNLRQRVEAKEKAPPTIWQRITGTEEPIKTGFTAKEQEEFTNKINDLKARIQEKENFIASLSTEQAWRPYAEETKAEFERLMESILNDSKILSL